MDVVEMHRRSLAYFAEQTSSVRQEDWSAPSGCGEWTVRELVNHVVVEDLWTAPLLEGKTIADVGDRYDGDVLGEDPRQAYADAAAAAAAAAGQPGAMDVTAHLSFGDVPGSEYTMQLFADHLIHGWDLARAVGGNDTLDPELVSACAAWFDDREDMYRGGGAIGPRVDVEDDADPQTVLLARFGRAS
ncbi:MAG: TIGR03086 family metal-binding protein [Mycobacteriales bacterium]